MLKGRILACLLTLSAFAATPPAVSQTAPDYVAIVAAPDRSDADRKLDTNRARPPSDTARSAGTLNPRVPSQRGAAPRARPRRASGTAARPKSGSTKSRQVRCSTMPRKASSEPRLRRDNR
jgi:hypothetical protein